mgnify:CR=1 FL=1
MKKYVDFIYKFRKPLIVLFILINIVSIVGITKIRLSSDFTIFMPSESSHNDTLEETFKKAYQNLYLFCCHFRNNSRY